MRNFLFASLLLLFALACTSTPKAASLPGTTWGVVTIMNADSTITIDKKERPTLAFLSDNEFSGQTLCNTIGGSYHIQDKDKIVLSLEAMTMAMCPDNTIEAVLIEQIGLTEFFTIQGDTLKMKDGDGRVKIKLCKQL